MLWHPFSKSSCVQSRPRTLTIELAFPASFTGFGIVTWSYRQRTFLLDCLLVWYFNVSYKLLLISLCLLVFLYCKGNIKASCIKCVIYAKSILTLNLDDDKDSNVLLFCFQVSRCICHVHSFTATIWIEIVVKHFIVLNNYLIKQ